LLKTYLLIDENTMDKVFNRAIVKVVREEMKDGGRTHVQLAVHKVFVNCDVFATFMQILQGGTKHRQTK
jgi:hypothetical protein